MPFFDVMKTIFSLGSVFFLLTLLGVIFLYSKKEKHGKIILVFTLLLYYFLSITPVADLLIGSLEKDFTFLTSSEIEGVENIVVLSGGKKADVLRSSEVIRLYNMLDTKPEVVVSGTERIDRKRVSGIELFFINRGVDHDNLHIEDKSKNTRENAERVVEKIGEESFFLVTSAYHMKRALGQFNKLGVDPIPAPTDFRRRGGPYSHIDLIPNIENIRKADLAIHEHLGILYYRFFD